MTGEPTGRSRDAFERAIEALSHKERTTAELVAWLAERGFGPGEVEATIDRLVVAGVLDDAEFARRFAADKRELRGWGPERIREALAARGLTAELIEPALATADPGAELARALELLERRGLPPPTDERGRARALAFLARRGYGSEVAYEAVRGFERRAA